MALRPPPRSSVADKMPGCIELFLPLSGVQVSRENLSRQVHVKWSDTNQERSTRTDGNYNPLYSCIYDENSPNIGLALHFRSDQTAESFEQTILNLSIPPSFSWTQPRSSGHVYDVTDTGADGKQYKAIAVFRSRLGYTCADLYYLYRDTDYIYDHAQQRVRFPRMAQTDYVSSHVDQLYRAERAVLFSHCEKKVGGMVVECDGEGSLRAFMGAITPYELVFSRRAASLLTKGKGLFGGKKSKKGDVEVQLWRRGTAIQLAARWVDDDVQDQWITFPVPGGTLDPSKDSNQACFPTVVYSRGTVLDMANIVSRSPKGSNMARREGVVTITFKSVRGMSFACLPF